MLLHQKQQACHARVGVSPLFIFAFSPLQAFYISEEDEPSANIFIQNFSFSFCFFIFSLYRERDENYTFTERSC